MTRFSMTLEREGDRISCRSCHAPIAAVTENWKKRAALSEMPVARLPGAGLGVDRDVVIRQFSCPACGALLDSETALPGDPFLEDMVTG